MKENCFGSISNRKYIIGLAIISVITYCLVVTLR